MTNSIIQYPFYRFAYVFSIIFQIPWQTGAPRLVTGRVGMPLQQVNIHQDVNFNALKFLMLLPAAPPAFPLLSLPSTPLLLTLTGRRRLSEENRTGLSSISLLGYLSWSF
jgi:hypothetical protein